MRMAVKRRKVVVGRRAGQNHLTTDGSISDCGLRIENRRSSIRIRNPKFAIERPEGK
jgi:hypothetical protein